MDKMSEDEKRAVEIVQGLKIYYDNDCLLDEEEIEENETVNNAIDTLINLIEKQQKKLEQEKEKNKELINGQIDFWLDDKEIVERIKTNYISKDKIKTLKENFNKKQSSFMYRSK